MAKIPIILEPGRADGKLAESQAIYDSILEQFQSDINREYKLTKEQVEFLTPIIERLNDVQDTLTSIDADKPLSAQQGKILKELLDAKVIEVGAIPMDSEPTKGNIEHVVTSDGIAKALNKKVDTDIFVKKNKNQDEKLSKLAGKTSEINKEFIEAEEESIDIYLDNDDINPVFHFDKNGLDAKNVKSNGKDVLTEHQDISGLATKKEVEKKQNVITQISEDETDSNEDEIVFASDDYREEGTGEKYANINRNGTYSKGYFDFSGNSVVKDYTQLFQASIKPSYNNGYKTSPLCIAHFSDIHSSANPLKRIISFTKTYANYIDDVINTGDSMGDHSADFEGNESSYAWYSNTQGSEKILNIIGNHDSALSGNKDGRWQYDWTGYGKVNTYNKFIKPYIANWNVVQPSNADDDGLSYYYKDYTDKKIRLIALDVMFYDDKQEVWFADTLNDAKTKGLSVLVIAHYPPKSYKGFDANYSSIDTNHVYNPASYNTKFTNAATIVQSFIDNGGDFICWLGGHEHTDIFGKLDEHPKQTVILADTAQTKSADNASITESSHIEGTGSQNAFNVVSFDVYSHLIKIFRVGAEYDRHLRKKGTICIDYKNVGVVSES